MKFTRLYTKDTEDPYKGISFAAFEKDLFAASAGAADAVSEDGTGVSLEKDVYYLPADWDNVSKKMFTDWLVIGEGVPAFVKPVPEEDVPAWLWKNEPDWEKLEQLPGTLRIRGEKDSRDVFNRIAGGWTYAAWKKGIFKETADASVFYDEIRYMLVRRMVFPETAQWKFIGTERSYGYREKSPADYSVFGDLGTVNKAYADFGGYYRNDSGIWGGTGRADTADASPPPTASDGIFDWGNFSRSLSGFSSGAAANRSVRKLVLDATHPEIESFIDWKWHEEHKVASLVTGSRVLHKYLKDIMVAASEETAGIYAFDLQYNTALNAAVDAARQALIPEHSIQQVLHLAKQGVRNIDFSVFDTDWDGNAYRAVSGNGVHTAVRVPHKLVEAAQDELLFDCWTLRHPVTGKPCGQTGVQSIWDRLATANWYAAEPTVEFDTTVQEWNTCKESGPLHSSAPSGGYIFQDNSRCFGATFNLEAFIEDPLETAGGWQIAPDDSPVPPARFDSISFSHAVRLMTVASDMTHTIAAEGDLFADNDNKFRALGLNICNLAPILMRFALAYDSDEARTLTGAITALMTAEAWAASAELAVDLEPFAEWKNNIDSFRRVMQNYTALANGKHDGYDGLTIAPPALLSTDDPVIGDVIESARDAFARAVKAGEKNGYRNAFVTLVAPMSKSAMTAGGRVSGIDPENTVVLCCDDSSDTGSDGNIAMQHRINPNVPYALRRLGYSKPQIRDILAYVLGRRTLRGAPAVNHERLAEIGFTPGLIESVESVVSHSYDIRFAFNRWTLGEDFCLNVLGLSRDELEKNAFDLLPAIGFSSDEIDAANIFCCGAHTLEGAPHIIDTHPGVFDCALPSGRKGSRRVGPSAHILMAASAGAFVNGGVGTTVVLDYAATIDMIKDFYFLAWSLGLKNISLYRQGAKLCQSRFQDIALQQSENENDVSVADEAVRDKKVVLGILSSPSAKRIPLLAGQIVRHLKSRRKMKELQESLNAGGKISADEAAADTGEVPEIKETVTRAVGNAMKNRLPLRRKGYTQKATVGGHKIYLRTGEYEDGTLGEIFIDMHKEGAAFRSVLNNFAVAVSMGLQYGVPLEEFVDTFAFTRFEPCGEVEGNESVTMASSVLDYIFRELAVSYLGRADLADIEPEDLLPDAIAGKRTNPVSDKDARVLDPDTVKIIRQAVSGGYTRQNLRRVQEKLLSKITANSNLAVNAAPEDERIRELGIRYEDADDSFLYDEEETQSLNTAFDVSEEAVREAIRASRENGYEGNCCAACGRMTILKIGHFLVCDTCSYIQEDSGR